MNICSVCGSSLRLIQSAINGYKKPNSYAIWECPICKTMVADPCVSDPQVYDLIYSVPGGAPGYDRNFQLAKGVLRRRDPLGYLASRLDAFWAVSFALKEVGAKTILEIGSGLGHFTYALKTAGLNAKGIDASSAAVSQASASYGNFFEAISAEQYLSSRSERFDAVVLIEVIEHLEHPFDVLASAMQLIKPGGTVIVTTPNRSFDEHAITWATDLPPVHLWWFSETSMEHYASRLNGNVRFVDFTPYNARYPILSRYQNPLTPMFDESGSIVRRESSAVAFARRLGVLQESYWLATATAGKLGVKTKNPRRPTMAALFSR